MAAPIPAPLDDDEEDVHWALSTASALWGRGERAEAVKWLRRAAEHASDANADARALELFKAAAEITSKLSTPPPPQPQRPPPSVPAPARLPPSVPAPPSKLATRPPPPPPPPVKPREQVEIRTSVPTPPPARESSRTSPRAAIDPKSVAKPLKKRQPTDPGRRRSPLSGRPEPAASDGAKPRTSAYSPPSEPASTSPMARSIKEGAGAPSRLVPAKAEKRNLGEDEVTIQRRTRDLVPVSRAEPFHHGAASGPKPRSPAEPAPRFDDLEEETRVRGGADDRDLDQAIGAMNLPGSFDESEPTYGSETNGTTSTMADPPLAFRNTPQPERGQVFSLPAIRVAVLASAGGEVRLVALDSTSPPPAGAATAILVPLTAADGVLIGKLFAPK